LTTRIGVSTRARFPQTRLASCAPAVFAAAEERVLHCRASGSIGGQGGAVDPVDSITCRRCLRTSGRRADCGATWKGPANIRHLAAVCLGVDGRGSRHSAVRFIKPMISCDIAGTPTWVCVSAGALVGRSFGEIAGDAGRFLGNRPGALDSNRRECCGCFAAGGHRRRSGSATI